MTEQKKNIAASVHQRLYNRAKENGEDFNLLLNRFANERFLYRLSLSQYKDRFMRKGALLFTLWFNTPHRPTRDVDFLGFGSSEIADVEKVFREVCDVESEDDGLFFNSNTVKGAEIKEGQQYQGIRIHLLALLGKARINLQFDVGFGDAVTPKAETVEFPTVLDFPAPELRVYPKETVVAEKFEAMVKLGMTNSRMKDFWDLRVMIKEFEFDGATLQNAIQATFERRQTAFPKGLPLALTDEFSGDKGKQTQWNAFIRKNKLDDLTNFETVIALLKDFFFSIILATNNQEDFRANWNSGQWTFNR
jgi:predicted nucleotidyltransferase component of viral defense system